MLTLAYREREVAATTDHIARLYAIAEGRAAPAAYDEVSADEVSASWRRSMNEHGVDPISREQPRVLTDGELKDLREPLAKSIVDAQEELDRLHKVVGQAGYVVLFCDGNGVAIDHRGSQTEADELKYWGTWLGGIWSEEVEGTNGIGTCIAEQRLVTVHRNQHFRVRHTDLSCSAAPIFDGGGKLIAVLDVSSIDPALSERSHALAGALVEASARSIEERLFRQQFRREWIVALAAPDGTGSTILLAVDQDQCIVGGDRNARTLFSRSNGQLEEELWLLFERDHTLFRHKDRGDRSVQLVRAGTGEHWPALVTPPASASHAQYSLHYADMHVRPRLAAITSQRDTASSRSPRGGLPPRTLHHVRDYVDSHLGEKLTLETLAATSGLSMHHFARAFKQSQGVTPHHYLLQRRIERARELLTSTDLSISEIASACGFSDQSHFARRFRDLVGVPPRTFKWSNR